MGASGRRCHHCAVHGAGCQLRLENEVQNSSSVRLDCQSITTHTSTSKLTYSACQSNVLSQHESVEVAPRKTKAGTGSRGPLHTKTNPPNHCHSPICQACQVLPSTQSVSCRSAHQASIATSRPSPITIHSSQNASLFIAANRHLALESPFLFLTTARYTTNSQVCLQKQN
jgi:hypothetical protein